MGSFVEQTGNNAYWSKIFAEVRDPTLVFFIMFSYAIYAWEDALENLSRHINKLVRAVIVSRTPLHEFVGSQCADNSSQ